MVGYGAQWLLSLSHALKILGLGKTLEDERWLGKGEEGYVRSGMGTERGARDKRWGHCGKGGQILRRARRNSGASSLSYLLACLREACVPGKVGPQGYTGLPTQFSPRFPLIFSLFLLLLLPPNCSLRLRVSLPPLLCCVSHLTRLSRLPQQSLKAESRPLEGSSTQLPILADMLLYYCRFAARPVLLQVYQTEVRRASCGSPQPSTLTPRNPWAGRSPH